MAGEYVVCRAEYIETPEEARQYYANRLAAKPHVITCHGRQITVHFPAGYTHTYSEDFDDHNMGATAVRRTVPGGREEVRAFSLDRARLMDHILGAIINFRPSLPAHTKDGRTLYGPPLGGGTRLCVVLRPGPGPVGHFSIVSAFPVDNAAWLRACRAKSVKFPPDGFK